MDKDFSLTFSEFIQTCADRQLNIKWIYQSINEPNDSAHLFCADGIFTYHTDVQKDSQSGSDWFRFEEIKNTTNKPEVARDADGNMIHTTSVFGTTSGLYPKEEEHLFTAPAGEITIFDTIIEAEQRLGGGKIWVTPDTVDNVRITDIAKFGVVDKNDVLGYFSAYGIPAPPVGILEFPKFVKRKYLMKGSKDHGYYDTVNLPESCASDVVSGLYTRVIIDRSATTQTGVGAISLIVGFKFYE